MNKEEYPIEEELEEFMQLSNRLMQENKRLKEEKKSIIKNIKRRKEKFDSGLWCDLDTMRMFNYLIHELEKGDSNEL